MPSPVPTPLTGSCVRCPYLRMGDGQSIDPDPPAPPLVLDGMIQKDPEDVVNHLCDLLLLWVLGVYVSQREHPVLPHRALQQAAAREVKRKHVMVVQVGASKPGYHWSQTSCSGSCELLTAGSHDCCWRVWSCRRGKVSGLPWAQRWERSSSVGWQPPLESLMLVGKDER